MIPERRLLVSEKGLIDLLQHLSSQGNLDARGRRVYDTLDLSYDRFSHDYQVLLQRADVVAEDCQADKAFASLVENVDKTKLFWKHCEETAKEVASWPTWMQEAGRSMLSPDSFQPHTQSLLRPDQILFYINYNEPLRDKLLEVAKRTGIPFHYTTACSGLTAALFGRALVEGSDRIMTLLLQYGQK